MGGELIRFPAFCAWPDIGSGKNGLVWGKDMDTGEAMQSRLTEAPEGEARGLGDIEALTTCPLACRLRAADIPLTLQRLAIAKVLFSRPVHLTAEQVLARVHEIMPEVSRATVYNTLKLFTQKGLLRLVIVDADGVVYDSNTTPHHHIFNAVTGQITDFDAGAIRFEGLPELPEGTVLEGIDIVLRVRPRRP